MSRLVDVLFLGPESDFAGFVHMLFQKHGLTATVAVTRNGTEFARELERRTFDIILADLHAPRPDVQRVLQAVRDNASNTPFLMVSGCCAENAATDALMEMAHLLAGANRREA